MVTIKEMALSRSDAISRCISLGKKFLEHFHKIYLERNSESVNHWISEMNTWYKDVCEIKLKNSGRPILKGNLRDWFFTAGSLPEDFIGEDLLELECYDEFCNKVISGKDVETSIKEVLGIK